MIAHITSIVSHPLTPSRRRVDPDDLVGLACVLVLAIALLLA